MNLAPRLILPTLALLVAACSPEPFACPPGSLMAGTLMGGQARMPAAMADANAREAYSREVAVRQGEVFLSDAAGRPLPGHTVMTGASGSFQLNRVPPGQALVVTVRARTPSGKAVELRGLARSGTSGSNVEVNAATTVTTMALLEGQRGAVGDYDQGNYEKLVARVYDKLGTVTSLDLTNEAAVIALFKAWAAQDAQMLQLYNDLRAQVTAPKISLEDQMRAIEQVQGLITASLPPRATPSPSGSPTASPSPGATPVSTAGSPAPAPTPTASPSPQPTAPISLDTSPVGLRGDVSTVAGSSQGFADGDGPAAKFNGPGGLAFDPQASPPALYLADTGNHRICKLDLSDPARARVTTVAGRGTAGTKDGPGLMAEFDRPIGLAFDGSGRLLVADSGGKRVRRVDLKSPDAAVSTYSAPAGAGEYARPAGLAYEFSSGAVFVADLDAGNVRRIAFDQPAGAIPGTFAATAAGEPVGLLDPAGVMMHPSGYLMVADAGSCLIRSVAPDGTIATVAGKYEPIGPGGPSQPGYAEGVGTEARFNRPSGLAYHPDGYVVVADVGNNRVRAIDAGARTWPIAGGVAGAVDGRGEAASFDGPAWVAIAPDGSIYVSDTGNHRVRRIS